MLSRSFTPPRQGFDEFTGIQVHAKDFNNMEQVKGRHVVIVGAGERQLVHFGPLLLAPLTRIPSALPLLH